MKHKIFLVSRENEEGQNLIKELSANPNYQVILVSKAKEALHAIARAESKIIVFNVDLFTRSNMQTAFDLRELGFECPFLILADRLETQDYKRLAELNDAITLSKPFEKKELMGSVERLIQEEEIKNRVHRRFHTHQSGFVQVPESEVEIEVNVRNVSQGGAYVEYPSKIKFKKDQILNIRIELKDVGKVHDKIAKVAWTHIHGDLCGAGLQFMNLEMQSPKKKIS